MINEELNNCVQLFLSGNTSLARAVQKGINYTDEQIINVIQSILLKEILDSMVYVGFGSFTRTDGLKITLTPFYISKYQFTNRWWNVIDTNLDALVVDNLPKVNVSWNDVDEFLKKLNKLSGLNFNFPTEAQWEYAARGGNKSKGYKYAGSDDIDEVAWYSGNSNYEVHPVGMLKPNELGLYDMNGNVWEWCRDWYGEYKKPEIPVNKRECTVDAPNVSFNYKRGFVKDIDFKESNSNIMTFRPVYEQLDTRLDLRFEIDMSIESERIVNSYDGVIQKGGREPDKYELQEHYTAPKISEYDDTSFRIQTDNLINPIANEELLNTRRIRGESDIDKRQFSHRSSTWDCGNYIGLRLELDQFCNPEREYKDRYKVMKSISKNGEYSDSYYPGFKDGLSTFRLELDEPLNPEVSEPHKHTLHSKATRGFGIYHNSNYDYFSNTQYHEAHRWGTGGFRIEVDEMINPYNDVNGYNKCIVGYSNRINKSDFNYERCPQSLLGAGFSLSFRLELNEFIDPIGEKDHRPSLKGCSRFLSNNMIDYSSFITDNPMGTASRSFRLQLPGT